MSQKIDPKSVGTWLSHAFKCALFPTKECAYIGHYHQKWLPDTTVVALIKLEFGLDESVSREFITPATLNKGLSRGEYAKCTERDDHGTGMYKGRITMQTNESKKKRSVMFYYIKGDGTGPAMEPTSADYATYSAPRVLKPVPKSEVDSGTKAAFAKFLTDEQCDRNNSRKTSANKTKTKSGKQLKRKSLSDANAQSAKVLAVSQDDLETASEQFVNILTEERDDDAMVALKQHAA